jgi:hypothetical protein
VRQLVETCPFRARQWRSYRFWRHARRVAMRGTGRSCKNQICLSRLLSLPRKFEWPQMDRARPECRLSRRLDAPTDEAGGSPSKLPCKHPANPISVRRPSSNRVPETPVPLTAIQNPSYFCVGKEATFARLANGTQSKATTVSAAIIAQASLMA